MMLYPSVQQLTNEKINRYVLVIAAAKGARIITDELLQEREELERSHDAKDLKSNLSAESVNVKAVSETIEKIQDGDFKIIVPDPNNYHND